MMFPEIVQIGAVTAAPSPNTSMQSSDNYFEAPAALAIPASPRHLAQVPIRRGRWVARVRYHARDVTDAGRAESLPIYPTGRRVSHGLEFWPLDLCGIARVGSA